MCGVDPVGTPRPVCLTDLPDAPEFCPGDHWANDACASCTCLNNGRVYCGSPDPECEAGG